MPYVGLVASRKRGAGVLGELRADGVADELLERIDVPAGLDIGARTPAEIALSILAEVIVAGRGRGAAPPAAAADRDAVDPVCGMTVAVVAGTPSLEHDGETVYFCCEGCKARSRPHGMPPPTDPFVTGLVLAAGGSQRLGRPKQLLPYGGGTLLGHVLGVARACRFDQLVVALGGAADEVRARGRPRRRRGRRQRGLRRGLLVLDRRGARAPSTRAATCSS